MTWTLNLDFYTVKWNVYKDDKAVELSTGPFREMFSVVLESTSNVVISGNSSTTIRIRDNDGIHLLL